MAAGAAEPAYDLVQGPAPKVRANQTAQVSLSLVPRSGERLLADGPVLVRVRGQGVRPLQALYRREDAADPRADVPRFELAFRAEREGHARLIAACTFYLCKGQRCRPFEAEVSWNLEVMP